MRKEKINILTEELIKVAPITGVSSTNNDNDWIVWLPEDATQAQRDACDAIVANASKIFERVEALENLDDEFDAKIAAGFLVQQAGFRLGLTMQDLTLLSSLFILAKECSTMGLPIPSIVDMNGVAYDLSINDLTTVMLMYGQYRASLSAEYAAKKKQILEG